MRTLKQLILALWVIGAGSAGLRADLLPRNHRHVQHTVRFANAKEVTNYIFYIYPRDLSGDSPGNSAAPVPADGVMGISALNPLAVMKAKDIYLVAIPIALHGPRDRAPLETWFTEETKGVLKCKMPAGQIRSLLKPGSRVEEVYEIKGLPKSLEVVRIPAKESAAIDSHGIDRGPAAILAGISALAMVALVRHSRAAGRDER
jgi:hypothetical protein